MARRYHTHDCVVVVTGAASTAGRALANQYAQQGTWLILIDDDLARLRQLTMLLRAAYPDEIMHRILKIVADLRDPEQSELAMLAIGHMFGEIDALINARPLAA